MPSISSDSQTFNFITLKGEMEPLGMVVEDVTRPGVNGHAYREDARRGDVFEMVGFADYTSHTLAESSYASMKARQGKLATVTDDRNTIAQNVMILSVEKVANRPIRGNIGGLTVAGSALALLVVRFRLQRTK